MTYYGYKPADQDKSTIDWGGLTKQISDDLLAEKKRRDDTKVFLDQEHSKQLQKINEFEQTQDPQANIWMTKQIQSARDFMMENHRLMKRGLRSVNDKRLVQQNVMNTYADVNNVLKNYNAKLIELEEAGGKSNQALIDKMAKFAQLKDRMIYNDPNTGAGYLADVDPKTGEINEKNLMPVRAINNMQQQAFKTVNVTEEVDKAVGKMATWKVALSATSDISNVRLNPKYQQTIDDLSKSILSSDEKKASVLLDYLDLDYSTDSDDAAQGTITYDFITGYDEQGKPTVEQREINIGKVFMELGSDGRLKHTLTKEQEDLALEAIKSNIETKLLFETSKDLPPRPRQKSAGQLGRESDNQELFYLSSGVAQGSQDAVNNMIGSVIERTDPDTQKIVKRTIGDIQYTKDKVLIYDDFGGLIDTVNRGDDIGVAQLIRGGESADKVRSAFNEGKRLYKGATPQFEDIVAISETQLLSQAIPEDEDLAEDYIKNALKRTKFQDVINVDIPWTMGDAIRLTNKETGDSKEFKTTDKAGIKAWLDQYGADLESLSPKGQSKKEGVMSEFSTQQ